MIASSFRYPSPPPASVPDLDIGSVFFFQDKASTKKSVWRNFKLEDAHSVLWDLSIIGTIVILVLLEKKTEGLFFDNYLGCDMK